MLVPWAYFTACWWLTGRTVGAAVVGLVVLRGDGEHVRLHVAALRAATGLLLWPLWLAGMAGVLTDPKRRAWHDRLFRTVVRYSEHR